MSTFTVQDVVHNITSRNSDGDIKELILTVLKVIKNNECLLTLCSCTEEPYTQVLNNPGPVSLQLLMNLIQVLKNLIRAV
jgi:hypothetical protein